MADSKRLLADALTGLMECKPLDQVRVAEIASAAGVSKQTFYHHFSDKYHLMECCFRDMFAAPFKRMGTLAPFDECYIEFDQGIDFEDAELVGLIRQCIPVGVARYFE